MGVKEIGILAASSGGGTTRHAITTSTVNSLPAVAHRGEIIAWLQGGHPVTSTVLETSSVRVGKSRLSIAN